MAELLNLPIVCECSFHRLQKEYVQQQQTVTEFLRGKPLQLSGDDRLVINEQNTSVVTGPLYVRTEFEAIWMLLLEDVAGIKARTISKELVQGPKICFPVVQWRVMNC